MVYRLRKEFIRIVALSFFAVFFLLFVIISVVTRWQADRSLDVIADLVSQNDGRFPLPGEPGADLSMMPDPPGMIDAEKPFSTRFFTVRFDAEGNVSSVDTASVASVTREDAVAYAGEALEKDRERGWNGDYRYKVFDTEKGKAVVFINGAETKGTSRMFLLTTASVFLVGGLIVFFLVLFISKRAVRPMAESYEKQKQFITDVNHELKTPLTLIHTNLEIVESELGENEWLQDIKKETEKMTALVGQLVSLARMDEEETQITAAPFDLSAAAAETAGEFELLAGKRGLLLSARIAPDVTYDGDEAALRQLLSILLDNAVKYCDPGGRIDVALEAGRHPVLIVENTCCMVGQLELRRLFDRFYRADRARTYGSGFGVGLSIAKAIAEKHRGQIEAQRVGDGVIRFRVKL